jgi:hypothetical protein
VLLSEAALNSEDILTTQHDAYVEAVAEGEAGTLEPNGVYFYGRELYQDVPSELVRSYFFWGDADQERETLTLVRMLQRMDVQVYQLDEAVDLSKFHSYADVKGAKTVPAGAYWVPMAQAQKHWIQAMLNRDTYVPVKQTYDVTGWSLPLLLNLKGGSTSSTVAAAATLTDPVDVPPVDPPVDPPTIGILELSHGVYSFEGMRQLEYLMDNVWLQPYTEVSSLDVADGALHGLDVLVVPGGGVAAGIDRLGPDGIAKLKAWVRNGGRFIGWKFGGGLLASKIGLTSAKMLNSPAGGEGLLVRLKFDQSSPLFEGVGSTAWMMFANDDVISHAPDSAVVASYPNSLLTSGLMLPADREIVEGTPAILDDTYHDGRVIVFPFDPNFRLYTVGLQKVMWNAIFGE